MESGVLSKKIVQISVDLRTERFWCDHLLAKLVEVRLDSHSKAVGGAENGKGQIN